MVAKNEKAAARYRSHTLEGSASAKRIIWVDEPISQRAAGPRGNEICGSFLPMELGGRPSRPAFLGENDYATGSRPKEFVFLWLPNPRSKCQGWPSPNSQPESESSPRDRLGVGRRSHLSHPNMLLSRL